MTRLDKKRGEKSLADRLAAAREELGFAPVPAALQRLEELVAVMRRLGLKRARVGDLEAELGGHEGNEGRPPAPHEGNEGTPPMERAPPFADDGAGLCACGHHPVTEHNEAGCLYGCSTALCESAIGSEPTDGG